MSKFSHSELNIILLDPREKEFFSNFRRLFLAYLTEEFRIRPGESHLQTLYEELQAEQESGQLHILLFFVSVSDTSISDRSGQTNADASDVPGFCILRPASDHFLIRDYYIRPEYRQNGLGRAFFRMLCTHSPEYSGKPFHLISSPEALPFWQALGFRPLSPYQTGSEKAAAPSDYLLFLTPDTAVSFS